MPAASSVTPAVHRVAIQLGERSYAISIGSGLLGNPASWAQAPASAQAASGGADDRLDQRTVLGRRQRPRQ